MDDDLQAILQRILDSADNTGCTPDLTVVSQDAVNDLKQYMKHYDLGGMGFMSGVRCKQCASPVDDNGFCTDITCPYSDWNQEIPRDLIESGGTTLDIVDECRKKNIPVKIRDEELRASCDLFECHQCGWTFDIEDSFKVGEALVCPKCAESCLQL